MRTPELETLLAGAAKVLTEEALAQKLAMGRPLRVKLGVDPTAPDIHLGHTVVLEKLRQFQELGHQAILIIGDFTAMIGDPSGRSTTRPPLTHEEVMAHAETYTSQAFKVIDREKTEVVYNGDWFRKMTFEEVLRLNSKVTMQQMLQREDFKERLAKGQEVRLHEVQYPIVQGWDSVKVRADVEIGGTDQLFNILVGRDLQKEQGQKPQVAMLMPLLEGLDGVKKMSKSYDNYVGVAEEPCEMFGKLMSVSDELMKKYYLLLLGETMPVGGHPMEAKKTLARRIVARFHGDEEAQLATDTWECRFSKRDNAAGAVEILLEQMSGELNALSLARECFRIGWGVDKSNGEIKKQYLAAGAIQLNGERLTNPAEVLSLKSGDLVRLSKRQSAILK